MKAKGYRVRNVIIVTNIRTITPHPQRMMSFTQMNLGMLMTLLKILKHINQDIKAINRTAMETIVLI